MKSRVRGTSKRRTLTDRVNTERKRRDLSIESLAKLSGYNERTIRNFLAGKQTRQRTEIEICQAVGIDIKAEITKREGRSKISDPHYGAYAFEHFSEYLGSYYAYRRSFSFPKSIVRSLYEFSWNDDRKCIQFKEYQNYDSPRLRKRVNYDQEGDLFSSNRIGLLHLLTSFEGALRLITLSKAQVHDMSMQGVVLTQADRPTHFNPAVSPIHFEKVGPASTQELAKRVGPIDSSNSEYAKMDVILSSIEQDLGIFVPLTGIGQTATPA